MKSNGRAKCTYIFGAHDDHEHQFLRLFLESLKFFVTFYGHVAVQWAVPDRASGCKFTSPELPRGENIAESEQPPAYFCALLQKEMDHG